MVMLGGNTKRRGDGSVFATVARFIVANSLARTLFLVYVGALHLLVLASTHGSVHESCAGEETAKVAALRGSDPGRPLGG